MSESKIIAYVRRALDDIEKGDTLDLARICADDPELIDDVAAALGLREGIQAVHRAAESIDPLVGREFEGRYRLEECLGRGAMGVVYAARDRELERTVAVKIFSAISGTAEDRERFTREARLLASLDHDHVVSVHDRGVGDDGEMFLVMDHLEGRSLSAVLHACADATHDQPPEFGAWWSELWPEPTPTPPQSSWLRTAVAWLADVASGLANAHARGVVHRDVKPSNVFIKNDQSAVLIDFGIATRSGDLTLTATNASLGTPWYMAPEQVHGAAGQKDAPAVDVYALCATLYHVIAMRPPYDGSPATVFAEIAVRDPEPIAKVRPNLPRDLVAIVERGMERDPARRYRSVDALEADLHAFLEHRPVEARPITKLQRAARNVRRRPAKAVAVLTTVVLLPMAAVAWWLWSEAAARESERQLLERIAGLPRLMSVEGAPELRPDFADHPRETQLNALTRILEFDPTALPYRAHLAALLADAGRFDAAAAEWSHIAREAPTPLTNALANQGVAADDLPEPATDLDRFMAAFVELRLRRSGFVGRALAHLDALETPVPDRLLPALDLRCVALVFAASLSGDLDYASRALAEAEQLDQRRGRETAATLATRGFVLGKRRQSIDAIAVLDRSLALCPTQYDVLCNLADAHRRMFDAPRAEQHALAAIALRPQLQAAYRTLASLHASRGEFDDARKLAREMPTAPESVWQRPLFLGELAALEANTLVHSDEARSVATARQAVGHFEAALELAPARRKLLIERRLKIANALVTRDWTQAAREMLDDFGLTGSGIDDPARLVAFALLLPEAKFDQDFKVPFEVFLYRLARTLAPAHQVASKDFRDRQLRAIREALSRQR